MQPKHLLLFSLIIVTATASAADLRREYTAEDKAVEWLTAQGELLGYMASNSLYLQTASGLQRVFRHNELASVELSESGEFLVAATHEPLLSPEQRKLSSEYVVLNRSGAVSYRANQMINADEKRYQAAVSDDGILALVDPLYLYLRLYQDGGVISEGQLFKLEGDRSLERKLRLWWHRGFLHILVEQSHDSVLLLKVAKDGRSQTISELPFRQLLDYACIEDQLFVSGYDYDSSKREFSPMILALTPDGTTLWTHANFGHELIMSENGKYLAALNSDTEISVFDLQKKRWQRFNHDIEGSTYMGIAVDNNGEPGACLVDKQFFVRRQVAPVEIHFPALGSKASVSIDPKYPGMVRVHCNGARHYLGTRHEWLEIRP